MTIQELIDALQKFEDKNQEVILSTKYGYESLDISERDMTTLELDLADTDWYPKPDEIEEFFRNSDKEHDDDNEVYLKVKALVIKSCYEN